MSTLANGPRPGSHEMSRELAHPLAVLGKRALPILAQRHPRRRLMVLPSQLRRRVNHCRVRQPEGRRPVRTIGAHKDSSRLGQQLSDDPCLFQQLTTGGFARRLTTLDAATWRHPAPPAMPDEQHLLELFLEYPHFGGKRIRHTLTSTLQPHPSVVELKHRCPSVAGGSSQRSLIGATRSHQLSLAAWNAPDDARRAAQQGSPPEKIYPTQALQPARSGATAD